MQVEQLNGLALAYLGDAAYEVRVRAYLLATGLTRPRDLHERATHLVSAPAQAAVITHWLATQALSDEEVAYFKRGRNASPHTQAKNASTQAYRLATGFESLLGYLYGQEDHTRFDKLVQDACRYLEEVHHGNNEA